MSPDKPTSERATETSDPRRLYDQNAGEAAQRAEGAAGAQKGKDREEQGDAESSRKHPPHEVGQDDDAPVLPANAQGADKVSSEEMDQPIREESMYDQRRDEDKERPPSTRG